MRMETTRLLVSIRASARNSCDLLAGRNRLCQTPTQRGQSNFPPIVTGPTVLPIGVNLIGVRSIGSGFKGWAGGSITCSEATPLKLFQNSPNISAPHAFAWGSVVYIGLGFSVSLTLFFIEQFGSLIMKSAQSL
ncbi:hypothetical protein EJ08DRAFT_4269 [Tothia fuscella]|uniref:Uncharacterized protein n=1 Tax=Tothia fuscella TaxID=1048955 RepID=A0A9P4P3W6_9PEZI|nr:hypothetical protein EJ08DRAFT_4269 [Tothia fuscella]